jgi:hypothetical protein
MAAARSRWRAVALETSQIARAAPMSESPLPTRPHDVIVRSPSMVEGLPAEKRSTKPPTTNTAHHAEIKKGTGRPRQSTERTNGGSAGSFMRQMSSMICFGRHSDQIGTNHPPIAQPAPKRGFCAPSAGLFLYAR